MILKTDATTWTNLTQVVEFDDDPVKQELYLITSAYGGGRPAGPLVTIVRGEIRQRVLAWLAQQDTGLALVERAA